MDEQPPGSDSHVLCFIRSSVENDRPSANFHAVSSFSPREQKFGKSALHLCQNWERAKLCSLRTVKNTNKKQDQHLSLSAFGQCLVSLCLRVSSFGLSNPAGSLFTLSRPTGQQRWSLLAFEFAVLLTGQYLRRSHGVNRCSWSIVWRHPSVVHGLQYDPARRRDHRHVNVVNQGGLITSTSSASSAGH